MKSTKWIITGLLLTAMTGCGGEKVPKDNSKRNNVAEIQKVEPKKGYPQYDYFERRMQILEHRVNAMNPESSELRELIARLKALESDNRNMRSDLSRLQGLLASSSTSDIDLKAKFDAMSLRLSTQEMSLADLRNRASLGTGMSGGSDTNTNSGTPPDVATHVNNHENLKEKLEFVTTQITALGREGSDFQAIIRKIRQYERESIPLLIEEMKDVSNTRKSTGCKQALIAIGSDDVVDLLVAELSEDLVLQESSEIVDALGHIANRRAEAPLLDLLRRTDVQFLKIDVAYALTKMNNAQGISTLIEFLKSTNANHRIFAIKYLRDQFGTDRAYSAYDPETRRAEAIDNWMNWYERTFGE